MTPPLILVTGPARSGKSEWAEYLAAQSHLGKPLITDQPSIAGYPVTGHSSVTGHPVTDHPVTDNSSVTDHPVTDNSSVTDYPVTDYPVTDHPSVTYVATAQTNPDDPEWQARILQHQQRRPSTWQTLHVPIDLALVFNSVPAPDCWLIDSLGTWLANLLDQSESDWQQILNQLLHQLQHRQSQIIIVSEETGWGVVPAYPSGRLFRDRLGQATRKIGQIADAVYLVTAGYVINLRQIGQPLPEQLDAFSPSESSEDQ